MVVELDNDDLSLAVFEAQYRLEDAQIRHRSGRADDLALAQEAKTSAAMYQKQLMHRQAELSSLSVLSQVDGRVVYRPRGETAVSRVLRRWEDQ